MALPASLKLKDGFGKYALRKAMEGRLPDDLLWGVKRGFADAIGGQFRAQAATVRARLTGGAMLDSGLFDGAALGRLVDAHASGALDHTQALWQLLVLEGFLHAEAGLDVPSGAAAPALVRH